MARPKKNELAGKLGGEQPQGWRDQVGAPEPVQATPKVGRYYRKTFLITSELEDRIREMADKERVGQNELVRYLLAYSLAQIESGKHKLPAKPVQQRTLGV